MNQAKDADYTGMPRWVKVTGLVVALLVLVVVVVMLIAGPGEHGPSRHGGPGEQTPPTSMPAGHQMPDGGHG